MAKLCKGATHGRPELIGKLEAGVHSSLGPLHGCLGEQLGPES